MKVKARSVTLFRMLWIDVMVPDEWLDRMWGPYEDWEDCLTAMTGHHDPHFHVVPRIYV